MGPLIISVMKTGIQLIRSTREPAGEERGEGVGGMVEWGEAKRVRRERRRIK